MVLVAILLVVADGVLRTVAQTTAEQQIEKQLPPSVSGPVSVHIEGTSFLLQFFRGEFTRIDLDAPTLKVDGTRIPVKVVARDVPTDLGSIGRLRARISVTESALNHFVTVPQATGTIHLGDGTIGFDGHRSAFGLTVDYRLAATPIAAGDRVLLSPSHASITTGPVGLDFSSVIKDLLASKPIPICLAPYLPEGMEVTKVAVTPREATLTVTARKFTLDAHTFDTHGKCH